MMQDDAGILCLLICAVREHCPPFIVLHFLVVKHCSGLAWTVFFYCQKEKL